MSYKTQAIPADQDVNEAAKDSMPTTLLQNTTNTVAEKHFMDDGITKDMTENDKKDNCSLLKVNNKRLFNKRCLSKKKKKREDCSQDLWLHLNIEWVHIWKFNYII